MKKSFAEKLFPLIIAVLFITPLSAQDSSLVGFWTFDDSTAVDSSIYANNGALHSNPIFFEGMKGSAIYLDGSDDHFTFAPVFQSINMFPAVLPSTVEWVSTPVFQISVYYRISVPERPGVLLCVLCLSSF